MQAKRIGDPGLSESPSLKHKNFYFNVLGLYQMFFATTITPNTSAITNILIAPL